MVHRGLALVAHTLLHVALVFACVFDKFVLYLLGPICLSLTLHHDVLLHLMCTILT